MTRTLGVLAFVSILASGCSWITVQGPPAQDPGIRPVDCTEVRVAPRLDSGAALGFLGLSAFALPFAAFGADRKPFIEVGVIAAIGLLFATSAWSGYSKTARCREMNRTPPPPSAALPPPSSMPPGMSPPATAPASTLGYR